MLFDESELDLKFEETEDVFAEFHTRFVVHNRQDKGKHKEGKWFSSIFVLLDVQVIHVYV